MAKKGSRMLIGLICVTCEKLNYVVSKNKVNTTTPLKMNKYCNKCKKHTDHKEKKKLD